MAAVMKERYTFNDAARYRKPREYVQTVIRAVKTAELNETSDHLLIVWNGSDVEFQKHIEKPNKISTLIAFFRSFDKRKHQW